MSAMVKHILDASVIIKWFSNEEGSDKARLYLERVTNRKLHVIIPELLYYEIGNILVSKKIKENAIDKIAEYLLLLPLEKKQVNLESFKEIVRNAHRFSISFYDASYISLMNQEKCPFITADNRLYEKVKKHSSSIKLL